MSGPDILGATNPRSSSVVSAAAGTGKTWLLVTRMLRLLLAGVNPASILAITFTRKAAGEMQTRLYEKLRDLACCSDSELDQQLSLHGIDHDENTRQRVRCLYSALLLSSWQPGITTFHSFCQSLLQQFPLEADIPPGFELTDSSEDLLQEALTSLYDQAGQPENSTLRRHLTALLDACDSIKTLPQLLGGFANCRADWWTWTQGARSPAGLATQLSGQWLGIEEGLEPFSAYVTEHRNHLLGLAETLELHSDSRICNLGSELLEFLSRDTTDPDQIQTALSRLFRTTTGDPRKWRAPKKNHQALPPEAWPEICDFIGQLSDKWDNALDIHFRHKLHQLLQHWYYCGHTLIELLQNLKTERRQLDFSDLEWRACQLLNDTDHSHWIQYKLDQKLEHILVDEFQDTNPSQWRLLQPLLQEIAAGDGERLRSVFLVGDPKQSIYGFRRANPELFQAAGAYLRSGLGADTYSQNVSRRSASAIIDFVNVIGMHPSVASRLSGFEPHETVQTSSPGHVELLPLPDPDDQTAATPNPGELRRPLRAPAPGASDDISHREGATIASRILELVSHRAAVGDRAPFRPLNYSDVLILVPTRRHVAGIENALRDRGIPYQGANRGTLMECQEVRDLVALLQFLSTPFDNIALATVLRSPIFGWDHAQLSRLAGLHRQEAEWFHRMRLLAEETAEQDLVKTVQMLGNWHELAGQLPVHDLLDHIYFACDIHQKYRQSVPVQLQHRVQSNLDRILDLALDLDSGRYPSLHRFLDHLHALADRDKEAPDEGQTAVQDRVRIMTVHGAKGLEAPVVFVADCGGASSDPRTWSTMTDWPAGREQPGMITLIPRKAERPQPLLDLMDRQRIRDEQEDMNLLYVAVTRARQYLYISASEDGAWYRLISDILDERGLLERYRPEQAAELMSATHVETPTARIGSATAPAVAWDKLMFTDDSWILPSQADEPDQEEYHAGADADGQLRGTIIHLLLDKLSRDQYTSSQAAAVAARLFDLSPADPRLHSWLEEATALLANQQLRPIFDTAQYHKALNEVPILSRGANGEPIHGIIDRLVIKSDRIIIVDYKTHRYHNRSELKDIASGYRQQMQYYRQAVQDLYPDRPVSTWLLFTQEGDILELNSTAGS